MYRSTLILAAASLATGLMTQKPIKEPGFRSVTTNTKTNTESKSIIDSSSLQDDIDIDRLLKRANELYVIAEEGIPEYNHPTRVIGSKGHLATIDYIYSSIKSLGDYYEISNQTFPAVVGSIFDYRLVLDDAVPKTATPMSLTPPTANKDSVFGPLVLVSNNGCDESDYPTGVNGSIALIRRGTCSFGDKSANAGKAGAIAAVVYNNVNGSLGGTLGTPDANHIATFGISDAEAAPYIEKLQQGKSVDGSAYIDAIVQSINTTNIVAQTKNGDPNNVVMLGGHSDSVAEGPGINDDGSGTISLLEVATQLVNYTVNNRVRFAWWAGEEEGLLGSDYYVSQLSDEENLKIRLFMDYDMMASPNYAYQVYNATDAANPAGSGSLKNLYTEWYKDNGLNFTYIPFDGRSDYDAFIKNGIPGGGIAAGAEGVKTAEEAELFGGEAGKWFDSCYHQLCDDVSNLALDAWLTNTKLIAHSVATYAKSFDGFPKRTLASNFKTAQASVKEESKYHGPQLVM